MKTPYLRRNIPITIGNKTETIFVGNFESKKPYQLYFCKFLIRDNNEESFYNKYDAYGFWVELENGNTSFKLVGKVDEQTAKEIWKQVIPKLSAPAEKLVFTL
ncbi:MAG TPA: hypothetical protein VK835_11715 [Bacteroidia bacterium]|jgi:hypothetical protein|nr:hypothetical protein [Bacteroidia bacterium]